MSSSLTAMVVGAGNFGLHHARILCSMTAPNSGVLPCFDQVIVTKTTLTAARQLADELARAPDCLARGVTGVAVCNEQTLIRMLTRHRPNLICIAAEDPRAGDRIHVVYSRRALDFGSVLCEKPFSNAVGDGASLKPIRSLFADPGRHVFGLELPLSLVKEDLQAHPEWNRRFADCNAMTFIWEAASKPGRSLIDDLALHVWSLIPETFQLASLQTVPDEPHRRIFIRMEFWNPSARKKVACAIYLRSGGSRRVMWLDNRGVAFRRCGTSVLVQEISGEPPAGWTTSEPDRSGKSLLLTRNPLKQHIRTILSGKPLIPLQRAYQSQLFLEHLHGFPLKPAKEDWYV